MKSTLIVIGAVTLSFTSSLAHAWGNNENSYYDEAKVIRVEPISHTVQIMQPQRECYQQEVRQPVYEGGDNGGAAIVGGVVGGILGHKLSEGRGGATIAGTILGAAIGNEIGRANAEPPRYHEEVHYQDRCVVRYVPHTEERIDGYRVTYRYRGETYTTQTRSRPGNELRIKVSVVPLED